VEKFSPLRTVCSRGQRRENTVSDIQHTILERLNRAASEAAREALTAEFDARGLDFSDLHPMIRTVMERGAISTANAKSADNYNFLRRTGAEGYRQRPRATICGSSGPIRRPSTPPAGDHRPCHPRAVFLSVYWGGSSVGSHRGRRQTRCPPLDARRAHGFAETGAKPSSGGRRCARVSTWRDLAVCWRANRPRGPCVPGRGLASA